MPMLRNNKMDDLRRMYSLFGRVPETLECQELHARPREEGGLALVSDQEKVQAPVEFVKKLPEMRDKYDKLVSEAFSGENKSQKRLKEAFEEFINADSRCASYLYVHRRAPEVGPEGAERAGRHAADHYIFRYLQDKDIFDTPTRIDSRSAS